jgi:hypothetical protein
MVEFFCNCSSRLLSSYRGKCCKYQWRFDIHDKWLRTVPCAGGYPFALNDCKCFMTDSLQLSSTLKFPNTVGSPSQFYGWSETTVSTACLI